MTRSRRAFAREARENFTQEASLSSPVRQEGPVSEHGSPEYITRSEAAGSPISDPEGQRDQPRLQAVPTSYGSQDSLLEFRDMVWESQDDPSK